MSNSVEALYTQYHLLLLENFIEQIKIQPPFSLESPTEEDHQFLQDITVLPGKRSDKNFLVEGQGLLCKVVSAYPHLMPLLYRDLLWFFGGDCLHYMPDEEIQLFQLLDEQRQQAIENNTPFVYEHQRAELFGLH